MLARVAVLIALIACALCVFADEKDISKRVETYLSPYIESNNFSGTVLVQKNGKVLVEGAYGDADRDRKLRNTKDTRFHVASVSMQFTAAAILRLIDKGTLRLEDSVAEYLHGTPGADKVTIRDLLIEQSGLPDINDLPDYTGILQAHQTPASLVAKIEGKPLLFEPGTKFQHEEHSAYNLLALIIEKKTGKSFSAAMEELVFRPAGLRSSGVDDDSPVPSSVATGYEPAGISGLKNATSIHWSAKTGNASIYTTAGDEAKLVTALFEGKLLSAASRELLLGTTPRVGYGWFRGEKPRFKETVYYSNGRSPGFASFVIYLPREKTVVVALSNIYSSATTSIGYDMAAIALGLPFTPFQPLSPPPAVNALQRWVGEYKFDADFYQPNAQIKAFVEGNDFFLRWPSGGISPLIPMGHDHFLDRAYWEEVSFERATDGGPNSVVYDRFRGIAVSAKPQ
jgi:CubicO group peptidase (beta-lactamase class C family)